MWVEGGVGGFGLVWDKVVGVEVFDETGEVGLCMLLESFNCGGSDGQGSVISVCVDVRVLCGGPDIVDIEIEECGGECAALWNAVSDGLWFRLCMFSV